jgi:hypothetical protein
MFKPGCERYEVVGRLVTPKGEFTIVRSTPVAGELSPVTEVWVAVGVDGRVTPVPRGTGVDA